MSEHGKDKHDKTVQSEALYGAFVNFCIFTSGPHLVRVKGLTGKIIIFHHVLEKGAINLGAKMSSDKELHLMKQANTIGSLRKKNMLDTLFSFHDPMSPSIRGSPT